MRNGVWLVVLLLAGCRDKKETPPPPPPAGPCTMERLEAWNPSTGVIASRERLPTSTTEDLVEVLKEGRANCTPDEDAGSCRARLLGLVRTWVPPDALVSLEPYEEPDARKWRGETMEAAGTVQVGGKEMPLMKSRPTSNVLFDSREACIAAGRTHAAEDSYGCSPAGTWGFDYKAERHTRSEKQHGQRLQVLWLYPKGADPEQSLGQFKDEVALAKFVVRREEVSDPGGWEVELACR